MTLTIGGFVFDVAHYDPHGDVLYLHVGPPRAAASSAVTPEQHLWRFDQNGEVIGLTLSGARLILERDGVILITPPSLRVDADTVTPALAAC